MKIRPLLPGMIGPADWHPCIRMALPWRKGIGKRPGSINPELWILNSHCVLTLDFRLKGLEWVALVLNCYLRVYRLFGQGIVCLPHQFEKTAEVRA